MYISLKSHHSPKSEAMASVIGDMEIKHQKCAQFSWRYGTNEHNVDGVVSSALASQEAQ